MLQHLGRSTFNSVDAERFVISMYYPGSSCTSTDSLRAEMFGNIKDHEKLPPTHDVLNHHTMRAHYQAMVWLNATVPNPDMPDPEQYGWICVDGSICPILSTRDAVPSACTELLTCRCATSRCATSRCTCRKNNLHCSTACKCKQECLNSGQVENSDHDEDNDCDA